MKAWGGVMSCPICASKQEEFSTEMVVHHSGLNNLDKSDVVLCTKILACSECGFSQFTIPKAELASLAATPPSGEQTMAASG
jgi:hypothetical protein